MTVTLDIQDKSESRDIILKANPHGSFSLPFRVPRPTTTKIKLKFSNFKE